MEGGGDASRSPDLGHRAYFDPYLACLAYLLHTQHKAALPHSCARIFATPPSVRSSPVPVHPWKSEALDLLLRRSGETGLGAKAGGLHLPKDEVLATCSTVPPGYKCETPVASSAASDTSSRQPTESLACQPRIVVSGSVVYVDATPMAAMDSLRCGIRSPKHDKLSSSKPFQQGCRGLCLFAEYCHDGPRHCKSQCKRTRTISDKTSLLSPTRPS